jgi:hypothetical protein
MSDDEPYVSVSTTITQEGIGQENHDQPIESSEIHTLAAPAEAPATPQLGAPALVRPFLLSVAQNITSWS